MKIGVIGSGEVGKKLAKQFIQAGNSVIMSNQHGPSSLETVIQQLGTSSIAGTVEEAAKQKIVLLAIPWLNVKPLLQQLPEWNGQIIIDATNQLASLNSHKMENIRGSNQVAKLAPGAHVIKAFNTLLGEYMDGQAAEGMRVLFFAGDDFNAKLVARQLFKTMHYFPVDVGDLTIGNSLMQINGALSGTHFIQPTHDQRSLGLMITAMTPGNPDVFKIANEVIAAPRSDEVQIEQHAIGMNYADVLARQGNLITDKSDFPLIDGFDA